MILQLNKIILLDRSPTILIFHITGLISLGNFRFKIIDGVTFYAEIGTRVVMELLG